jgi:hypothetical protein
MRRRLLDLGRMVFISGEFPYLLLLVAIAYYRADWFSALGRALTKDAEMTKWVPGTAATFCAASLALAWKLTVPLGAGNRDLLDWRGYDLLKARRNYSVLLTTSAAVGTAVVWIFAGTIDVFWIGWLAAAALGVSLISVSCMFNAALTLREILEK